MLTIASNVRKSTAVFAQSLHEAGIRVKRAIRVSMVNEENDRVFRDSIEIRGQGKFRASLVCDYELGAFKVRIATKKGVQAWAVVTSYSELRALFSTWNFGDLH
jgi:hypothetical protein